MDRDRWVRAGLEALEEGGLRAVAVEPLARRLGITKGSFYWHFEDRRALLRAVLELWIEHHVDAPLAAATGDAQQRLRALFARASTKRPSIFARLLEGRDDPDVAAALQTASDRRLAFLAACYRELGSPAPRADAELAYAVYLGIAQRAPRDRAFARRMAERLIP